MYILTTLQSELETILWKIQDLFKVVELMFVDNIHCIFYIRNIVDAQT